MTTKPTIAIVNNERNILTSLRLCLEAEQFKVRTYSNTADALDLLDNPADLALIDKTNPPIGGMELYRRIRERNAMPVVFLSAWAEDIGEELRGTARDAQGYIPTPFSQRSVVQKIREILVLYPPKKSVALVIDPSTMLEP